MPDDIKKQEADIVIRTMKGDLEKIAGVPQKEEKPAVPLVAPLKQLSKEAQMPVTVILEPPRVPPPTMPSKPPILIVPPKIIPPKEFPEISARPLYKATPAWIKLGAIGFSVVLIVFLGLYGYWKIFIQVKPPEKPPITAPPATTPGFPITPSATTTAPIKFFNKLPNKSVTMDLPSKTPVALLKALKSEAAISETRASVKQLKITYLGKTLTTQELFDLLSIFSPRDFILNYENEFALAYFSQKEGVRPILILKTKNRELAQTQVTNWEKTTFASDIFPLFLTNFKLPATLPAFKPYLFVGQPVRFLNVSVPFASLNYAIYNDFLIFTTSSAGMFVVLQDLTGQSVSRKYLESLEASINKFVK